MISSTQLLHTNTAIRRSGRAIIAIAIAYAGLLGPAVGESAAWCTAGITEWNTTGVSTGIRTSIPSAWNQTMTNVLSDWNNVAGSNLNYSGPVFNDGYPNRQHTISKINFPIAGYPDSIPGVTYNSAGSTHAYSYVYLNQSWFWNTSGLMNQALKKVDVHTVTLHEVGHSSGLAHPFACDGGAMTEAEQIAVMNPQYVKKWDLLPDDKAGLASLY